MDYDQSHREVQSVQLSSDTWIFDIEYADDVVILAENFENLNFILERVNNFLIILDLRLTILNLKSYPLARQLV